MRVYRVQQNIGAVRYVVSFHDGVKAHMDGSPFFDIRAFRSKSVLKAFIAELHQAGYTQS